MEWGPNIVARLCLYGLLQGCWYTCQVHSCHVTDWFLIGSLCYKLFNILPVNLCLVCGCPRVLETAFDFMAQWNKGFWSTQDFDHKKNGITHPNIWGNKFQTKSTPGKTELRPIKWGQQKPKLHVAQQKTNRAPPTLRDGTDILRLIRPPNKMGRTTLN